MTDPPARSKGVVSTPSQPESDDPEVVSDSDDEVDHVESTGDDSTSSNQPSKSKNGLWPSVVAVQEGETVEEKISTFGIMGQKKALIIPMVVVMPDGFRKGLHALIDTGCEVNLVKKGLIPQKYFQKSKKGVRLVTASGSLLGGGDQEVRLDLVACGYQ